MTPPEPEVKLSSSLDEALAHVKRALEGQRPRPRLREVGRVRQISTGVAVIDGLPNVQSEELLRFPGGCLGMALNLDADRVGAILLDSGEGIEAGDRVERTGRVMDAPVGDGLLGRVIDPAGRPLDGRGTVRVAGRREIEQEAPPIMHRAPVTTPLQTGIKVIDAVVPIGRGQRELIVGDRQTGKTAIAIDTIINQKGHDVVCIYCAIGQRSAGIAQIIEELREHDAMDYTVVVATTGEDPSGFQWIAPYAATSMGEYFMEHGRDVLVIYDDMTNHARAYRELSLLLRRPPGREAYPGDIFYIHSRLLERATHLNDEQGGGSLTALPIVATEAQNISAYIPTNLISITDGQIYLSPQLFQQGILPAVDVGRSVSRVGGKAQLPAYREVAGDLKLTYAQFEELERFSRYGTRLDEERQKTLERGRRVRESFKQARYDTLSPGVQMTILLAVVKGLMDELPLDKVDIAMRAIRDDVRGQPDEAVEAVEKGEKLTEERQKALLDRAQRVVDGVKGPDGEEEKRGHQ